MFISNGSQVVVKTAVSLTSSSWFTGPMPPMSSHGWPSAYAGIYSGQLWVYVVVNKLAAGVARLPMPVYERDDLNRPRADDHPMAELLRQPNPAMSSFEFWFWVSATRDVFGEAPVLKRRKGGRVAGLYPLHPTALHRNDDGTWRFDNGTLRLDSIAPHDLMLFKHYHPHKTDRGLSPLEPLRLTLENEWHARNATSSFWQRGARPGMALTHPGTLSADAAGRVRQQFDDIASGSGNTGRTVVLEEGMKPEKLMLTAEEAQYIETRKLNREEACAAYDVPPPAVHILDHATYSNITEQMRSVYRDTQAPRLKYFESVIERELRMVEWPDDDVYAEFMMDEVLRGDFETRQEALAGASHMTIAEKRKIENLPFIDGTDRIFLNTATMPLDAIDAQAAALTAATAPAVAEEDPSETVPLSVVRAVMGRLSWQRSLDQVDLDSVAEGLEPATTSAVRRALVAERVSGGSVKGLRDRLRAIASKSVQGASMKAAPSEDEVALVAKTLADFFTRQGEAVLGAGSLDREKWDAELAGDLHATAVAVSSSIGKAAVRSLGFEAGVYDVDRTVDFLRAVAERYAANINETTASKLAEAEEPAAVFTEAVDTRSAGIATGVTTMVAGFAVVEAGRHIATAEGAEPTKTWVTGPNARASHAAMNGQTVGIDEEFSNGMKWPGSGGDVDEVAGCNCSVEVEFP